MSETQYTETPWYCGKSLKVEGEYCIWQNASICDDMTIVVMGSKAKENAEFIVQACNSYKDLLAIKEKAYEAFSTDNHKAELECIELCAMFDESKGK